MRHVVHHKKKKAKKSTSTSTSGTVISIAFGTSSGTINDPVSGEVLPVPVFPQPLEDVAEITGGAAYEAATETELTPLTTGQPSS